MSKAQIVDKIYDTLFRQTFTDFYEGEFLDHLQDGVKEQKADEDKIKEKIKRIFNLS
jgi:hypothetical protein